MRLSKIVMNEKRPALRTPGSTIQKRWKNIQAIWNNEHNDDVGIEKMFRLFLALSQFLFPGIYIKHLFSKYGENIKSIAMDMYIIMKLSFPLTLIYWHWLPSGPGMLLVLWFILETMFYVPTLIFASDTLTSPSSYRRSILLLFLNYIEIVFGFAYIYSLGNYLNRPLEHWFDAVYFSFTTMSTMGFGDYVAVTPTGKLLVCIQSVLFLSFVVLFINFFSRNIEMKGYFGTNKREE